MDNKSRQEEQVIVAGINFRETLEDTPSSIVEYKNKCHCPLYGPDGLMVVGCQCGGL